MIRSPAPTPAGQEREALLAGASTDEPRRHRSSSYGSRGPEEASSQDRQSFSNGSVASPAPGGACKPNVSKGSAALLKKSDGSKVDKVSDSVEGRTAAKDGSTLVRHCFFRSSPCWIGQWTAIKQRSVDSESV